MAYQIIRYYIAKPGKRRTIARGLTLREARAYCGDPDTASFTCSSPTSVNVTLRNGPWFDHFEKETG